MSAKIEATLTGLYKTVDVKRNRKVIYGRNTIVLKQSGSTIFLDKEMHEQLLAYLSSFEYVSDENSGMSTDDMLQYYADGKHLD